ncbi:cation diffusion facilitator family transporter [Rhizosaccharibacter radicis]|uniref:Cation diffusion facilitator family transporter n=1 Tax=Rhizosaccharibacter radicis TaxID=2782605 RepID=A0ABT1VZQ4_9PROT|nr:cation diffusion facilitator family transporter [Acetobacteraceae bacterium KSS12]
MDLAIKTALGSLGISLLVLATKMAAYVLTGSVALFSDAIETIINVAAAVAALLALWYSARPADANHPYGHGKAEYFSAVLEGGLVLATAVLIAEEAWRAWEHPRMPDLPLLGIGLNAAGGAINLVWSLVLRRIGRARRSPALLAGSRHVMTDVWTSVGVIAGVSLVPVTGWARLDPLVAALVAVNIVWTGYKVLRESVGGLMDEITDPEAVSNVRAIISRHAIGAIEAHDVRTRMAGRMIFVEFHLVVPARMTVEAAHEICDQVEQGIRTEYGEAVINIHVEPEGKAKHQGVLVLS